LKRQTVKKATERAVPKEPGPVRTCLGCGKKQRKSLLHRLVFNAQHQPLLDRAQNAPGRGAYLCGPGCLSAAIKKKAFQRAFKKAFQQATNHPLDLTNLEADLQPKR
jgi:predicted RNA-binding protein YlxR (DUF448 family)